MLTTARKALHILKYFFISICFLIILLITAINLPFVHVFIARQANGFFKDRGVPVHVGSVSLSLKGDVELSKIEILSHVGDTIVYAGDIRIDFRILPLFSQRLIVNSISADDLNVHLITDSLGTLNLISLFATPNSTEVDSSTATSPWEIQVGEAKLNNIRFYYSDIFTGILINQTIGTADLHFELFSLLKKQVDVGKLLIDKATGSTELWDTRYIAVDENTSETQWKFSAYDISLTNILYDYKNTITHQQAGILLSRANIRLKNLDLSKRQLEISELNFNSPYITFSDSQNVNVTRDSTALLPQEKDKVSWTLECNILDISNGYFDYESGAPKTDTTITQWMPVNGFSTKIENIVFSSDKLGCDLKQLAFSLNNKAHLHAGELFLEADSLSQGKLKLQLLGSVDYMNKMHFNHKDTLEVEISVSGSLKRLIIDEFKLSSSSGMELTMEGTVKNVDKLSDLNYDLLLRTNPISRNQLQGWLSMANTAFKLPDFSPASVSGKLNNTIDNPNFNLLVNSGTGRVGLNGNYNLKNNYSTLNATIIDLKLKDLFGEEYPTNIYCSLTWDGFIGELNSLDGNGELKIDSLQYKDVVSRDIELWFDAENNLFHFTLLANDTTLSCALNGEVTLDTLTYRGKINGEFSVNNNHASLLPGNLSFKSAIDASFDISPGRVESGLELNQIKIANEVEETVIDSFFVLLDMDQKNVASQIRSDFIAADFKSSSSFTELKDAIFSWHFDKIFNWDSTAFITKESLEHFPQFSFTASAEYDSVFMLFVPDSIFKFYDFNLEMSKIPEKQTVDLKFSLDSLSYMGAQGFGAKFDLQANENGLNGDLKFDSLNVNRVATGKAQVKLNVLPDKMVGFLSVEDSIGSPVYQIGAEAIKTQSNIVFTSTVPEWILNSEVWSVTPRQFLTWELLDNDLLAGLNLNNSELKIELNGRMSDSLLLNIENVPIHKIVSPGLIAHLPDGILNVDLVYSERQNKQLDFDLTIDDLNWREVIIKKVRAGGFFRSDSSGAFTSNMLATLDDSSTFSVVMEPALIASKSNIKATFSKIPAMLSEPFIHDYIDDLSGAVSGDFLLSNDRDEAILTGKLIMESISMNVVPLNSWFTIPDDTINISNNHIYFNNFAIYDSLKKELFVNGNLDFTDQEDIRADLKITMDNLLVMNTTIKENSDFYGKVIVKSQLNLDGPVANPSIKGNVTLVGGTNITYRQVNDVSVQETQKTVNFVNLYSDTAHTMELVSRIREISDMPSIQTTIQIDPQSRFNFDIYSGYEIRISILGSGLLNYSLLPNNTMSLTGRYEISEGTSKLKFSGWPIKDFLISKGSSIRWDGDVENPEVNLEATSKVKGSYVNPVDNKNRTVDFIVSMKLTDLISQLKITFDVKSPDQYISSVLSSLSEDELMRQAINLLIFESINLPNIESNSNYLTSQINSFWESQLNSISKTSIKGVDLSFGIDTYQQETASGGSEEKTSLTYEMERKILKNRASVKVSGRLNDDSQTSGQSSNLLENFTFEYELDTLDRKFLKLYTRRDYEDILDGEVTKSGVGFIYRKSYPDFKSIWRRKKKE